MRHSRRALTMLELVIASSLLTVLVTSATLLLRTSRQAWTAQEQDHQRLQSAQALLRHVVRHARQAQSVVAASGAGDASGSLSLEMPSGDIYVWNHDNAGKQVDFGVTTANGLLADSIESLEFVGYEADGTTPTNNVADMQVLRVTATVDLPREVNGVKTLESWVWLRAW